MLSDPAEAEMALVRYYNTTSGGKTGRKEVGPLWEALAMVRAGINIRTEPFLQVNHGCRRWVLTSRMRETQAPCQHAATCIVVQDVITLQRALYPRAEWGLPGWVASEQREQ